MPKPICGEHRLTIDSMAELETSGRGVIMAWAQCPNCGWSETVYITRGQLESTHKFGLVDGRLYHLCGSQQPCTVI